MSNSYLQYSYLAVRIVFINRRLCIEMKCRALFAAFLHYQPFLRVITDQNARNNFSRCLKMSHGNELDFMSSIRNYAKLNQKNNKERIDASLYNVLYSPEILNDDADADEHDGKISPVVTLFTKEDGAPELVKILRLSHVNLPHTLRIIDITHPQNKYFFDRYKYDVPILHMGNQYWTLGRNLTPKTAALSLNMVSEI